MNLMELIQRAPTPSPWTEGEKIPWNEPGFSARMLKDHLNQNHDLASRRLEKVEQQVKWIHRYLLQGKPKRILDLGCGPGFYTSQLSHLGHTCVGIDFSPASIAYAAADAADRPQAEHARCTYALEDIRIADYGSGFDLVMLIFGEFNVFKQEDACTILSKAYAALNPGGILLLEPQTEVFVRHSGLAKPIWYTSKSGLFSDKPHLCLVESNWDEAHHTATNRYFVFDGNTGYITRYASTTQAYSDPELHGMLEAAGFQEVTFYPALIGENDPEQPQLFAITACK